MLFVMYWNLMVFFATGQHLIEPAAKPKASTKKK